MGFPINFKSVNFLFVVSVNYAFMVFSGQFFLKKLFYYHQDVIILSLFHQKQNFILGFKVLIIIKLNILKWWEERVAGWHLAEGPGVKRQGERVRSGACRGPHGESLLVPCTDPSLLICHWTSPPRPQAAFHILSEGKRLHDRHTLEFSSRFLARRIWWLGSSTAPAWKSLKHTPPSTCAGVCAVPAEPLPVAAVSSEKCFLWAVRAPWADPKGGCRNTPTHTFVAILPRPPPSSWHS